MEDCRIENCAAQTGGGISITEDGSLVIESCIIRNNMWENGGGIGSYKGKVTIKGSSVIKGNTAKRGGGIYLDDANCTFESGIIGGSGAKDKNTASDDGGVCMSVDAVLIMKGGSITGNEAVGKGVWMCKPGGDLSMTCNALITSSSGSDSDKPGKNDVYLADDQKIQIEGELTQNIDARITPQQYTASMQVPDGSITAGTPKNYTRFMVTSNGSIKRLVDSSGKLKSP